jgi:hypothetical protein
VSRGSSYDNAFVFTQFTYSLSFITLLRLFLLNSLHIPSHITSYSFSGKTHGDPSRMLSIVDCRSRTSAMANAAAGAGYESQNNYPSSKLDFFNIPNIHAVRESLSRLSVIIMNPTANPSSDCGFSKQVILELLYFTFRSLDSKLPSSFASSFSHLFTSSYLHIFASSPNFSIPSTSHFHTFAFLLSPP